MEWKSCHFHRLGCTRTSIGAVRQRDIQDFRRTYRILRVGLIEIAATEKQHRVRVLRFDVPKLLHHRS